MNSSNYKKPIHEVKTRNELVDCLDISRKTLTSILYFRGVDTLIYILFFRENACLRLLLPCVVVCFLLVLNYTTKQAVRLHSFIPICADAMRQNGEFI